MSLFRALTEAEKKAAQIEGVLREYPWLWAVRNHWQHNDDSLEVPIIARGERARNLLNNVFTLTGCLLAVRVFTYQERPSGVMLDQVKFVPDQTIAQMVSAGIACPIWVKGLVVEFTNDYHYSIEPRRGTRISTWVCVGSRKYAVAHMLDW